MLLRFGAVLSIICGILMAVSSFLRLLKLHKLAVYKLDLLRRGLILCHGVLHHGLNLHRNIPFFLGGQK